MGISYFDMWSFGHLWFGILSFSLLQYSKIPILVNFFIANGIHYFIEKNENNVAPDGAVLETYQNHIGDIFMFLLGWIIAFFFRTNNYVTSGNVPLLWIILLVTASTEILRENYPYEPTIGGAYYIHNVSR